MTNLLNMINLVKYKKMKVFQDVNTKIIIQQKK